MQRRHLKETTTPDHRLEEEAMRLREEAQGTPYGAERASQAETASHVQQWLMSPEGNVMDRDACLKNAAGCRENAASDPARADYWTDESIIWLQRAIEASRNKAVTYEVRGGRMIAKSGK